MKEYVMNKETGKIELHFEKEEYMSLSEEQQRKIKSAFLFSGRIGAWVSRAKFPNLYRAERVAAELGFVDGGKVGEQLSFEEQMERKAERAQERAERYQSLSAGAAQKGEQLQKPINDKHGDVSFFTQPNVNSSSGRAFSRRREKMFASWERGFEEFKKSEYYAERAAVALENASSTKPTDKGFIDRRIKDAEKTIRKQMKNLEQYRLLLSRVESGEKIACYNNGYYTQEQVSKWIEDAELMVEGAISKAIYYYKCLEEVGGIAFCKDNVKVGYIVNLGWRGKCKVIGTGRVNITYEVLEGGAKGWHGKAAYAEIDAIVSTES